MMEHEADKSKGTARHDVVEIAGAMNTAYGIFGERAGEGGVNCGINSSILRREPRIDFLGDQRGCLVSRRF